MPVRWKGTRLSGQEPAEIVAYIADRLAVGGEHVAKYPEALEGTGLDPSDITPHVASMANRINSRAVRELEEKWNAKVEANERYLLERELSQPSNPKRNVTMKITRQKAVALLEAVGFKQIKTWNATRIAAKLNKLSKTVDEDYEIEDNEELNELLGEIREANENDDKIEVGEAKKSTKASTKKSSAKKSKAKKEEPEEDEEEEDDEEDEEEEDEPEEEDEEEEDEPEEEPKKAAKSKKGKAASAKKSSSKKSEKKPAKKKAEVEKDKFGCRVNSQAGQINAVIAKKSKDFEQIAKESGCNVNRVKGHCKAMIAKGNFKSTSKGIALA